MDNSIRLLISIEKFTFEEGDFSLKEIHFTVRSGEGIALLGVNGAGKTTLLKLIDGLYKNYQGEIRLDGREIRTLKPREIYSKMGLLFQNPEEQLFAERVFEDVAFGPRNMGWREEKVREAVKRALLLVGLEGYDDKKIFNLSFGQKKRVALAGLLAMGQEILLLDEPTLGLDPIVERNFIELLNNLKKEGKTIIVATHNVDLVPYFADRVVILSAGRLVLQGPTKEILTSLSKMTNYNLRPPLVSLPFYSVKNNLSEIPLTPEEAEILLNKLFLR
ncbi:MAG: energy-coupling factor ABC transporter ATP-binding protein [Caldimicrobium sp.]|nr:energy-coupling factor ABC transporter ATP-binding protein [Caldimicrobium sp.]MCX7874014.1 energy-coupling factor ABC transporter ATP-binding protein [Caldimicrobium sp.]MDW8094162.1 ABC transporter ATP-binding protein [Caldimicrobium sp.]